MTLQRNGGRCLGDYVGKEDRSRVRHVADRGVDSIMAVETRESDSVIGGGHKRTEVTH